MSRVPRPSAEVGEYDGTVIGIMTVWDCRTLWIRGPYKLRALASMQWQWCTWIGAERDNLIMYRIGSDRVLIMKHAYSSSCVRATLWFVTCDTIASMFNSQLKGYGYWLAVPLPFQRGKPSVGMYRQRKSHMLWRGYADRGLLNQEIPMSLIYWA